MSHFLTKKQQWRRVRSKRGHPDIYDFLLTEAIPDNWQIRALSESAISTTNHALPPSRLWQTTGDLFGKPQQDIGNISSKPKKKVRFNSCIKIVLIADRQDYIRNNLASSLWFNDDDYRAFKSSALMELSATISLYQIDSKMAIKKLYQPGEQGSGQSKSPFVRSFSDPLISTEDLSSKAAVIEHESSPIVESSSDQSAVEENLSTLFKTTLNLPGSNIDNNRTKFENNSKLIPSELIEDDFVGASICKRIQLMSVRTEISTKHKLKGHKSDSSSNMGTVHPLGLMMA